MCSNQEFLELQKLADEMKMRVRQYKIVSGVLDQHLEKTSEFDKKELEETILFMKRFSDLIGRDIERLN